MAQHRSTGVGSYHAFFTAWYPPESVCLCERESYQPGRPLRPGSKEFCNCPVPRCKPTQASRTDKTLISFRGCDLGRSDATLISIGQFFGGRGVRVEAARVGAEYRWSEKPGELTRVGVVVGKRFFDFTSKAAQPYINRLKVNQGPFEVGPGQQPLGPKPDVEIPVFQRRRP